MNSARVIHRALLVILACASGLSAGSATCANDAHAQVRPAGVELGSTLLAPTDIYNAAGEVSGAAVPPEVADAADAAFAAARQAVAAGQISDAFRHASAAASLNPDHAEARRLLGYTRVDDAWAGGYAQQMLKSGYAWRPQFGWIKDTQVEKFEQGLRPSRGRWITPEQDARQHESIDRGWTVRTDHFLVTTNIDRAAGAELAVRLESLYAIWRQLFGEFTATQAELAAQLEGKETGSFVRKPFHVIYHRNRDEYNAALRKRQPQIDVTLGIYFDAQRESHFFAGPDQDAGTIAHEAVHQFFYESAPRATRRLATTANVWAVEGAACYFESLEPAGLGAFHIGAADAGRLQAARHRRVVDNYYVPLAELTALGMTDMQQRPDLPRLYSQSAGLASFLIDGEGGKYRPAFRELLAAIYAGRDEAGTLAKAAGKSEDELDRAYLKFVESLPVTAEISQ